MKPKFKFFSNPDRNLYFLRKLETVLEKVVRYSSFITFGLLLYHLGYDPNPTIYAISSFFFTICLFLIGFGYILKILLKEPSIFVGRVLAEIFLSLVLIGFSLLRWNAFGLEFSEGILNYSRHYFLVNILVVILFFIEISKYSLHINRLKASPTLVFISSFLLLIFVGAILLSLPHATTNGISFIDALFTSTSAVCVTGLIVMDTAKDFTFFGQTTIMILFQIGGLGMMTFTSFFGFFFKGNYSIENQLFIRDYINENNVGEIYSTLLKIIFFTVITEVAAAFLIYHFTDDALFANKGDQLFFAAFTAISAFCNAGFSNLSNGLYESGFREAYNMHLVLAMAIILGGIGFPVFINYYNYLKHVVVGGTKKILGIESYKHVPRITNISTKLSLYTTGILLVFGFFTYAIFESNHTLEGLSPYGKFVTTIFGAVTPRTAGFNTVDMTMLSVPTILIYLILMWIGASPGSTGGGLKTSTFAVAILNTLSIATGKKRVEIFRRQISNETLQKAFAVIALSFLFIGLGIFLVMLFNPELALIDVAFEVFSAFSTVGLSLGITSQLGAASKVVIMICMFMGRVGTLTILIAIVRKAGQQRYKYPEESVFIT
ncbi:TrkH family potassium uptake protein [Algoriphagus machipongonensis]|uniref:Potassium uptake protein KtrB n=1 Tax=Algoriphagus machipongonensis TaxID=388413 RepID=A3HUF6_9BACT|nr:potassium transporter TrkG [Algoriphagus machipongonensis]EAZ81778.1 potassium uptake protein KtrB [Algoriphagus machipongonensis]